MRDGVITEADTCREFVTPRLVEARWGAAPCSMGEQRSFTNGGIIVAGGKVRRGKQRRADYLLYYRRDYPLAVVEAKETGLPAETGVQQAREYAEMLGLKFAYATNGHRIVEIDYITGTEREVDRYATPDELFERLTAATNLPQDAAAHVLEPFNLISGKVPRYYQQIAINRVIEVVLRGEKRILATLATGTGKTCIAFQICWKLWNSRWTRLGEHRRPKILFLADRNILVDDPMAKMFAPFGDARHKITGGDTSQSRDMYFGIYQALTTASADVFRQYRPDFFDLIVIDECHRGSSRAESAWRAVLDYFEPAVQFGMTATPLREESRDSYEYFGNPVYTYSLRQGIADGFLAPYRVHRVITTVDAAGWRPSEDELDRYGREVPDDEYQTKDFERVVALRSRTRAMARHLTDLLTGTDRFAKTLIFCVDQDHAAEMRQELLNLNSDLVRQYPDYVCRVTTDEGTIGLTHLSHFQDVDRPTPVILTTSQLLTTGIDAEMVKNVVLARVVGSRSEFKQIVGRGSQTHRHPPSQRRTAAGHAGAGILVTHPTRLRRPMKASGSKPTWAEVKTKLADFDRAGLLGLVHDLYMANKDNQAFLHARFAMAGDDVLKPYKATIDRWLWPDVFKNQDTSVAKAKKAIVDYKKAVSQSDGLAELMVFYCERAAGFSNDVGLQDEVWFDALLRMFEQALKTVATLPEEAQPAFWVRLDGVRDISQNIGYGVGDGMDELLTEHGVDD